MRRFWVILLAAILCVTRVVVGKFNSLRDNGPKVCVKEYGNTDIIGAAPMHSQHVYSVMKCLHLCMELRKSSCRAAVFESGSSRGKFISSCRLYDEFHRGVTPKTALKFSHPTYYEFKENCDSLHSEHYQAEFVWSPWTPCSSSCGEGIKSRDRICMNCTHPVKVDKELINCFNAACKSPKTQFVLAPELIWDQWGPWGRCSKPCGGYQVRRRSCLNPRVRLCPVSDSEQRQECICQRHDFSSSARWLNWGRWTQCSVTCGQGQQERIRQCTVFGRCEGDEKQTQQCQDKACDAEPQVAAWGPWEAWSCSVTCGSGTQTRRRSCPSGNCPGSNTESSTCFQSQCPTAPVGDVWAQWAPWGACSVTCGGGQRTRSRQCPTNNCPGLEFESDRCSLEPCQVEGWAEWAPWGSCSATCGEGQRSRIRVCNNPSGFCQGDRTQTEACQGPRACQAQPCGQWSPWGQCSVTCGPGGEQERIRFCPETGNTEPQKQVCLEPLCPVTPQPVGCQQWQPWGQCSVSCGQGGFQTRTRFCPQTGRTDSDSQQCFQNPCPTLPQQCGPWEAWGQCNVPCGFGGTRSRRRQCPTGDEFEDENCPFVPCPSIPGTTTEPPTRPTPQPDCQQWSPWSTCQIDPGATTGSQTRVRVCGQDYIPDIGKRPCGGTVAPNWLEWSRWQPCSQTCDNGFRVRSRACSVQNQCPGSPNESESCKERDCEAVVAPVGNWRQWNPWQPCSVTCGEGLRARTRSCGTPNIQCPGSPTETETCRPRDCPAIAIWQQWEPWLSCSTTCGIGTQFRTRTCTQPRQCPGTDTETQPCSNRECDVATWGPWQAWSDCSSSCGQGVSTRIRRCSQFGQCAGNGLENMGCNSGPCDEPTWQAWSPWSACSTSCGAGQRTRGRQCSQLGQCRGLASETGFCQEAPCAASWRQWEPWGVCSVTCGQGNRIRSRQCTVPGQCFDGEPDEIQNCFDQPCQSNWLQWQPWSPCSASCNEGERSRRRECSEPNRCIGNAQESENCFETDCVAGWLQWGSWSSCTATCGPGQRLRSRQCSRPGSCFAGERTDTESCFEQECPDWGPWTEWSQCSVSCGTGQRRRSRQCSVFGACLGQPNQNEICESPSCGLWEQWGPWSACSVSCGDTGRRFRSRSCSIFGQCIGETNEVTTCDEGECVQWAQWGQWTACTVSCGVGQRTRTRQCPQSGQCPGDNTDFGQCDSGPCAQWQLWGPWSQCSASCGNGQRSRTRQCSQPGACLGRNEETDLCDAGICLIYSDWSPWSICSATCGMGMRGRARSCPKEGLCQGPKREMDFCNENQCFKDVNREPRGIWGPWAQWSECSQTCATAFRRRQRRCETGPSTCDGGTVQSAPCFFLRSCG